MPETEKREKMVVDQIVNRGVSDSIVIEAMKKVERHLFVQEKIRASAYEDFPLSIGYEQTISQPYIVAIMTEEAELKPSDKVLEIGTGSGYQAAILAEIVDKVYTIEFLKPLADEARKRLETFGYKNIFVKNGDGYEGWLEFVFYDAIIVTAAPSEIPYKLIEQLKLGGKMIIPIGSYSQELYCITNTARGIIQKSLFPVRFVPMVIGHK